MDRQSSNPLSPLSPLEQFVRDYVEARDGAWDEIEPQVYDLLLGPDMLQVAFDPEALPEHPQAQLASLGSPVLDRLLADAASRWSSARFYRIGLNLHPHGLEMRLRRAITLPSAASLGIERIRAMNFPQAVFWFKAAFVSDQKEEEIIPIGIDLHHLRQVRHLDALLAGNRLSAEPQTPLPEARHAGVRAGYGAAWKQVVPSVSALANARRRDWTGRVEKQISRMSDYYGRLRDEAADPPGRGADPAAAMARAIARRAAVEREEQLRIAELRQKSRVHVRLRLASMMIVSQPKLSIAAVVMHKDRAMGRIEAVWDPLLEAVEAVPCPACGRPTFELRVHRGGIGCPGCGNGAGEFAPAEGR
jgi:hypothetical protein